MFVDDCDWALEPLCEVFSHARAFIHFTLASQRSVYTRTQSVTGVTRVLLYGTDKQPLRCIARKIGVPDYLSLPN